MERLNVSLELDVNNPKEVKAFMVFIASVSGVTASAPTTAPKEEVKTSEPEEKPKTSTQKAEEKPKASVTKPKKATDVPDIKDLQEAVRLKSRSHRDEIKAKLKEYDAVNISGVPEENRSEFLTFVNDL